MEKAKWKEFATFGNQFGNILAGPITGVLVGVVCAGVGVLPFALMSDCDDYALPYNKTETG